MCISRFSEIQFLLFAGDTGYTHPVASGGNFFNPKLQMPNLLQCERITIPKHRNICLFFSQVLSNVVHFLQLRVKTRCFSRVVCIGGPTRKLRARIENKCAECIPIGFYRCHKPRTGGLPIGITGFWSEPPVTTEL